MPVGRDDNPVRADPRYGWLAAFAPADARRFRVDDRDVAAVVADAGGELVDQAADVDVTRHPQVGGDADTAIVVLDRVEPRSALPRALRGVRRVGGAVILRAAAARTRRSARSRGYRDVHVFPWERGARLPPGLFGDAGHASSRRLRVAAVVRASRRERPRTALDDAMDLAAAAVGRTLKARSMLLGSSGCVLVDCEGGLLRGSMGGPGRRIADQASALAELERANPDAVVAERVPWMQAHGSAGLASWSLERGLSGRVPPPVLAPSLLDECIEFLAALHRTGSADSGRGSIVRDGELVAARCGPEAREVRSLAARAEDVLSDVPRGFAHGDFWSGNLLTSGGRLLGVVDWPSGGPGRLPLLDLLHLELNAERERTRAGFGEIVRDGLLPSARAGGTQLELIYCRRAGLVLGRDELEALVVAYWLTELAHDLSDPDRDPRKSESRAWWERDVMGVLRALVDGRAGSAATSNSRVRERAP